MVICKNEDCMLHAHGQKMDHDRRIFEMDCFVGKSCFDILHSKEGRQLWQRLPSKGQKRKHVSYSVNRSSPVYKHLKQAYGLPQSETMPKKRARLEDCVEEDSDGGTGGARVEDCSASGSPGEDGDGGTGITVDVGGEDATAAGDGDEDSGGEGEGGMSEEEVGGGSIAKFLQGRLRKSK